MRQANIFLARRKLVYVISRSSDYTSWMQLFSKWHMLIIHMRAPRCAPQYLGSPGTVCKSPKPTHRKYNMHCHIVIIPGDADITPPPKINPRICIRSGASQTLLLGGSHTLAQWRVVDSLIVLAFLLHRIGRSLDFVVRATSARTVEPTACECILGRLDLPSLCR